MHVNISARHGHLSAQTQEKIREKVEKLSRFFDRLTAIQITVDLEHPQSPTVEIRVSVEHREDLIAAVSSSDVMSALDSALPKVEQQLRKHKEKITGHRSPGGKHFEVATENEPDAE